MLALVEAWRQLVRLVVWWASWAGICRTPEEEEEEEVWALWRAADAGVRAGCLSILGAILSAG